MHIKFDDMRFTLDFPKRNACRVFSFDAMRLTLMQRERQREALKVKDSQGFLTKIKR